MGSFVFDIVNDMTLIYPFYKEAQTMLNICVLWIVFEQILEKIFLRNVKSVEKEERIEANQESEPKTPNIGLTETLV
jgi:hypothetical protein